MKSKDLLLRFLSFLLLSVTLIITSCVGGSDAKDKETKNPNIILFLTDDQGWSETSVKMMKNMPGVEGIQILEILPDQATIMVDYQGEARALADALILNPYDNFGINIYEVMDKRIKLELVPG